MTEPCKDRLAQEKGTGKGTVRTGYYQHTPDHCRCNGVACGGLKPYSVKIQGDMGLMMQFQNWFAR